MEELKNRAKASLTADGLQERYVDRRVVDYDEIEKERVIDSRDVRFGLVDTYGQFDLSELCWNVEEQMQQYFEQDEECDFGDEQLWCEFETQHILDDMANWSAEYFMSKIDGLKLRTISIFSPSEYNFSTDWCEWEIIHNPFKTKEQLIDKMREITSDKQEEWIDDEYIYFMNNKIDEYLNEHIAGYYVGDYDKLYEYDELLNKFRKGEK